MKLVMYLKDKFKLSNSMKNISKISFGTMLGQVISFIVVPIYATLYGASVMGEWTLLASISTMVLTFSDLGMRNAIMLEKDEDTTTILYSVVTTVAFIISIVAGIVLFGFYSLIGSNATLLPFEIAIFVVVQSVSQQQVQICYTWLNKKAKYNVLMKNPIINNLSSAVIIITLGMLGFKKYGYYIGLLVGQLITLVHMRVHLPKKFFTFKKEDYVLAFADKKEFYLYQMPANILAQFKNQSPVFFIKLLFGAEILGYYSISMKYLKIPISLLAESIGRVYFQTVSRMKREAVAYREIGEFSIRNINKAMHISILPMIIILSVGDIACEIMFGQDFVMAGTIMRIVSFNTFFLFLATSTQGLPVILRKQSYTMISAAVQIVGYAGGLWVGYYFYNSIYVGCVLMTTVYAVAQLVYFVLLFKVMGIEPKRYLVEVIKVLGIIIGGSYLVRVVLYLFHIIPSWL